VPRPLAGSAFKGVGLLLPHKPLIGPSLFFFSLSLSKFKAFVVFYPVSFSLFLWNAGVRDF